MSVSVNRWVCFSRSSGCFLPTWHYIYPFGGKAHVLCALIDPRRDLLVDRVWKTETTQPAHLCVNCLMKAGWRYADRAEW